LFRNPITKESKEIEICPRHFKETVEDPLIAPIKILSHKRANLISRNNKERALAKKYDKRFPYEEKRAELESLQEKIKRLLSFKCSNILCGTSLSTLNPVYSMMIISGLGKISYKFYFCSKQCWDKMRIRTGAIVPPKERTEIPLKVFMEEQ